MHDIFCTRAAFFQVVETSSGIWRRHIPGRTEKIPGTPQRGYYERVLMYQTLSKTWEARQIIERPQLVDAWHDGDPNLMDLDFYLWQQDLQTDAPWQTSLPFPPPNKWRLRPVKNVFRALMTYFKHVFNAPNTYRITLKNVKWNVKRATQYAKEHVHGCTCTQIRNMERDGEKWRKISCGAWSEHVDVFERGTGWTCHTYTRRKISPTLQGDVRRRYKIIHGPATLVYDTETHLEWENIFPYEYFVRFDTLFTDTR